MKKLPYLILMYFISNSLFSQSIKGVLVQEFISITGDDTILTKYERIPLVFEYYYFKNKSIQTLLTRNKSKTDIIFKEQSETIVPVEHKMISPTNLVFYKDFNQDIYKHITTIDDKDQAIKDKILNTYKWQLVDETKVINGFVCKKATTLNTLYKIMDLPVIAWYCEKIQINDGPCNYAGLPGFIIKIEVGKYSSYTFQDLIFNKEEYKIDEPINSALNLTFEENKKR